MAEIEFSDVLFGRGTFQGKGLKNKLIAFLCLQRPMVVLNAYPLVIGTAIAAIGELPSYLKIIEALISYYLGVASMHTINDFFDRERDKKKWPLRPIPSVMVSKETALAFGLTQGLISLITSFIWFNWQTSLMIFIVIFLGAVYTYHTRDKIGWLTGIFPPAFIATGAWVAFSPETINSPLPWLLFSFMAIHQIGMIGAEEHPSQTGSVKPLLKEFNDKQASYFFPLSITALLFLGVTIHIIGSLHWVHLITLLGLTIANYLVSIKMIRKPTPKNFEKGFEAIINYNIFYWLALGAGVLLG